ncbi:MAG TPA: heavy metal-binding domain-containing protein [Pirellulaceae bacterium]
MWEFAIQAGVILFLLGIGFFAGSYSEKRHFRDLVQRESQNGDFLITQLRSFPAAVEGPAPPKIICGEAVIGSDYLKSFLSGIRKIFGGELRSYLSLLERARREALQRVVEQARAEGYNAICNVRYDSADIAGNATGGRGGLAMVTILASATAYHFRRPGPPTSAS